VLISLNYVRLLRKKGSGCSFLQQLTRSWHAYGTSREGITKEIIHWRSHSRDE